MFFTNWIINMNIESLTQSSGRASVGSKDSKSFFEKYSFANTNSKFICLKFNISDLFNVAPFYSSETDDIELIEGEKSNFKAPVIDLESSSQDDSHQKPMSNSGRYY